MFNQLLQWSLEEYSHLPWRNNRTLYTTLVSEIMLQQTTVGSVIGHYQRFLQRFPTVEALGKATEEEVCIQWKGLGYYRRARMLRAACSYLWEHHGGIIPLDLNVLMKIPGIGLYTANAILAIGANQRALPVDANLERVLARIFTLSGEKGPVLQKKIYTLFLQGKLLPDLEIWGPRDLSEAFMDLGRTVCRAQKAECLGCPMKESCLAYQQQLVSCFPQESATSLSKKKTSSGYHLSLLRIWVTDQKHNKLLTYQKGDGEWLSGQWELPTFILSSEDQDLKQYPLLQDVFADKDCREYSLDKLQKSAPCCRTTITKYKIDNYVIAMEGQQFQKLIKRNSLRRFQFQQLDFQQANLAANILKIQKLIGKKNREKV